MSRRSISSSLGTSAAARPLSSEPDIALGFAALCERPCSFAGLVPQARSLILKPPLEFWRPRQEEPFEQAATVEVERAIRIVSVEGLSEGAHIAPKLLFIDTHFLVASAGQHIGVERSSQAVQRLPQRGAGMLLVELRPQE